MKQSKSLTRRTWTTLAILAAGATVFAIPSCQGMLTTFNPCGTVFDFCEPYEIDALFADTTDYSLDPTCSIAFYGIYGADDASTCASDVIYLNQPQ
jgi:hypothetical protein